MHIIVPEGKRIEGKMYIVPEVRDRTRKGGGWVKGLNVYCS